MAEAEAGGAYNLRARPMTAEVTGPRHRYPFAVPHWTLVPLVPVRSLPPQPMWDFALVVGPSGLSHSAALARGQ